MSQITLTLKYKIADNLIISASTLVEEYLHGIPLTDSEGRSYSFNYIKKKILDSTVRIENLLFIKVIETTMNDQQDFVEEEWRNYAHVKLNYAPNAILKVEGWLSTVKVFQLPEDQFTIKGRSIAFVPGGVIAGSQVIMGISGNIFVQRAGARVIPNFWRIQYTAGMTVVPNDILAAVSKLACIQLFAVLGDVLLGPGISGQSLSLDGLSQSIQTTISSSTSAYNTRIKQYAQELTDFDLPALKDFYRGITFEVV